MNGSFRHGRELLRLSARVLFRHPRLLVAAALSIPAQLGVFVATNRLVGFEDRSRWNDAGMNWQELLSGRHLAVQGLDLINLIAMTWAGVAVVHLAFRAFREAPLRLTEGVGCATKRLGAIVKYSLLIGFLEFASSPIGTRNPAVILAALLFAVRWMLMFLAVPILAREDGTLGRMLVRSAGMFRSVWREAVGGSLLLMVWTLPFTIALVVACMVIASTRTTTGGMEFNAAFQTLSTPWVSGPASLAGAVFLGLGDVFSGVLYVFVSEGVPPGDFDRDELRRTWRVGSSGSSAVVDQRFG